MIPHNHDKTAAAAAPRNAMPSSAGPGELESNHPTQIVWIRRRPYVLDVTTDPVTHCVLSYHLRSAPSKRSSSRKVVV